MKKTMGFKIKNYKMIYVISALIVFSLTVSNLYFSAENAKKRANYWVAKKPIPIGQIIRSTDVELKALDLGDINKSYLEQDKNPVGLFAKKVINSNELIAESFIGKGSTYRNVSLKIPNGHLPPNLKENDEVDVWFSDPLTNSSALLIPRISVVWVDELNTNFGGVSTVVVATPQDLVATLIKSSRTEGLDLVQIEN
ncbi:MAG: hypothetical protein RLZZ37_1106 [Actinomycetota bacterium]|jgi:hypothetical protein